MMAVDKKAKERSEPSGLQPIHDVMLPETTRYNEGVALDVRFQSRCQIRIFLEERSL